MSAMENKIPKTGVRLRPESYDATVKAVAIKTLNGEPTNLSKFASDALDSVTAPILKSAGVAPFNGRRKAKVTK